MVFLPLLRGRIPAPNASGAALVRGRVRNFFEITSWSRPFTLDRGEGPLTVVGRPINFSSSFRIHVFSRPESAVFSAKTRFCPWAGLKCTKNVGFRRAVTLQRIRRSRCGLPAFTQGSVPDKQSVQSRCKTSYGQNKKYCEQGSNSRLSDMHKDNGYNIMMDQLLA